MKNISYPIALSKFEENLDYNVSAVLNMYQNPGEAFGSPEPFYNSTILVLASYWEAFCIDLIIEGSSFYHFLDSHEKLPDFFKRIISLEIKNDNHELSGWKLADEKWKSFIKTRASKLSTNNYKFKNAKPESVTEAFKKYLGIELDSDIWIVDYFDSERNLNPIVEFIEIRNEIAHEGGSERQVEENFPFLIRHSLEKIAKNLSKAIDTHFFQLTGEKFYEHK
ncbi:MAG: HEPN domain-containing protein [Balneola sp.]